MPRWSSSSASDVTDDADDADADSIAASVDIRIGSSGMTSGSTLLLPADKKITIEVLLKLSLLL